MAALRKGSWCPERGRLYLGAFRAARAVAPSMLPSTPRVFVLRLRSLERHAEHPRPNAGDRENLFKGRCVAEAPFRERVPGVGACAGFVQGLRDARGPGGGGSRDDIPLG